MISKCKHEDCSRESVSKGCCDMHYRRLLLRGSIYNHGARIKDLGNDEERFHKKYSKNENGCWIWHGGTRPSGKKGIVLYGRHHLKSGKSVGAHRYSYSLTNGS